MNKITSPFIALALSLSTASAWAQESVKEHVQEITCSPLKSTPYIWYATVDRLRENKKIPNFEYTSLEKKELWEIAYNDYLCKLQKYTSEEEFIRWSNKLKQLLDIIIKEGLDPKKVDLFNDLGREVKDRIEELKNQ
jgi:hypothetical protein